jgi:hypothetical protein
MIESLIKKKKGEDDRKSDVLKMFFVHLKLNNFILLCNFIFLINT